MGNEKKLLRLDLNPQHTGNKANALPTELLRLSVQGGLLNGTYHLHLQSSVAAMGGGREIARHILVSCQWWECREWIPAHISTSVACNEQQYSEEISAPISTSVACNEQQYSEEISAPIPTSVVCNEQQYSEEISAPIPTSVVCNEQQYSEEISAPISTSVVCNEQRTVKRYQLLFLLV